MIYIYYYRQCYTKVDKNKNLMPFEFPREQLNEYKLMQKISIKFQLIINKKD